MLVEYNYVIICSDRDFSLDLKFRLKKYEDLAFVSFAKDKTEGLFVILKHRPDIVFINLSKNAPEYFKMVVELRQYFHNLPIIIGISNDKQYVFKAIKNHFFDYWLLPYSEWDISKSLLHAKAQIPEKTEPKTLCLKSYRDFQYLNTDDILYLKSDNNTTCFTMKNSSEIIAYKTLKVFEKQLPEQFKRIHQSYILNTDCVSGINYGKNLCTIAFNNSQVPFSKSYIKNIDELKKKLAQSAIFANK
ncbi:LytR/AlgR family response regulator transcription factor [Maribacter sp. HTCC2170]|uniref:LytR/AlgR family response regulator transcription factor n=1 Tax=Maribacter sp. (strain HTCC2170 / KCCM 42371) TaxID=313603 RepID=UPI00006B21F3|nr:LytTR family DNA-binding domain-containing protein [Maribacter sp. HTCC2170]EAR00382.1 response regulator LytR [Maribacter sp. HTCC2170]